MTDAFTPEQEAAEKRFTESPENQAWLRKQWDIINEMMRLKNLELTRGIVFHWTGWETMDFVEWFDPSPTFPPWWYQVGGPMKWEDWT